MSTGRSSIPPALRAERIIAAFKQLLGDSQPTAIAITLALATTLGWFGTASYEVFLRLFDPQHALPGSPLAMLAALAAFPLLAAVLLHLARGQARRVPLRIAQHEVPRPARALIMFLSTPGDDETLLQAIGAGTAPALLLDRSWREQLKRSWRMPVEAIAYHMGAGTLERIALIPSTETAALAGLFAKLVARITNDRVKVYAPAGAGWEVVDNDTPTRGCGYEDAEALAGTVEAAYAALTGAGYQDSEILIDITAGQKVAGVAGAAIALAEGRRFQYVSTRDYHVRSYDITYQQ